MPGGRSGRRSLLGAWAAPPMLLVDRTRPSARESGGEGGRGGAGGDGIIMRRSEG